MSKKTDPRQPTSQARQTTIEHMRRLLLATTAGLALQSACAAPEQKKPPTEEATPPAPSQPSVPKLSSVPVQPTSVASQPASSASQPAAALPTPASTQAASVTKECHKQLTLQVLGYVPIMESPQGYKPGSVLADEPPDDNFWGKGHRPYSDPVAPPPKLVPVQLVSVDIRCTVTTQTDATLGLIAVVEISINNKAVTLAKPKTNEAITEATQSNKQSLHLIVKLSENVSIPVVLSQGGASQKATITIKPTEKDFDLSIR